MFGIKREVRKILADATGSDQPAPTYGGHSMIAPLRRVVVRTPAASRGPEDATRFGYPDPPDDEKARSEHAAFIDILTGHGIEVIVAEPGEAGNPDAIFMFDPSFMTDEGVILLRPGKDLRRPEVALSEAIWHELAIPVVGDIEEPGTVEGGDILWIDTHTVAVGESYRTNAQGIDQLEIFLRAANVDVVRVQLPHWHGEQECLHLLSLLSPVAEGVAVAYLKLLPVPFVKELRLRGWSFIDVPDEEFATQATNILALAPGKLLMLKDNPVTIQRLREMGYEVLTYTGDEISHNRAGGPTCLTNPLLRDRLAMTKP
jgi:N-dimethylarginine dimethylaminohydrolase